MNDCNNDADVVNLLRSKRCQRSRMTSSMATQKYVVVHATTAHVYVHTCAQITTILLALERSFPFETAFIRRLVTAMLLNLGICAHLGSKLVSVVLETAHLTQCLAAIPAIQFNTFIT